MCFHQEGWRTHQVQGTTHQETNNAPCKRNAISFGSHFWHTSPSKCWQRRNISSYDQHSFPILALHGNHACYMQSLLRCEKNVLLITTVTKVVAQPVLKQSKMNDRIELSQTRLSPSSFNEYLQQLFHCFNLVSRTWNIKYTIHINIDYITAHSRVWHLELQSQLITSDSSLKISTPTPLRLQPNKSFHKKAISWLQFWLYPNR